MLDSDHCDRDALDLIPHAVDEIEERLDQIATCVHQTPLIDAGPCAADELAAAADRLSTLAERALQVASLCEELAAEIDGDAAVPDGAEITGSVGIGYEWDVSRLLKTPLKGQRGILCECLGEVQPGTAFVIEDCRRGSDGLLIGVTWDLSTRPFDWLTPRELRQCTQRLETLRSRRHPAAKPQAPSQSRHCRRPPVQR